MNLTYKDIRDHKPRRMECPGNGENLSREWSDVARRSGKIRTQKCLLDLTTLLSLRGVNFSPVPILWRTPTEEVRTARTRDRAPQVWREADICVGMEETSSEVQRTSWAWRRRTFAKLERSMQQHIKFQKGQTPSKTVRLMSLSFESRQRRYCSSRRMCPLGWLVGRGSIM